MSDIHSQVAAMNHRSSAFDVFEDVFGPGGARRPVATNPATYFNLQQQSMLADDEERAGDVNGNSTTEEL